MSREPQDSRVELEHQLCILSKQTIDSFLARTHPAEVIALYVFYYYTAKWQKTDKPEATVKYVAKGLHWKPDKVRKVKHELIKMGLIEDFTRKDGQGRITGWYIKVKYIWRQETVNSTLPRNPEGGKSHSVDLGTTNALSALNRNALSVGSHSSPNDKNNSYEDAARRIYDAYGDRVRPGARADAIRNITKRLSGDRKKGISSFAPEMLLGTVLCYASNGLNPDPQYRYQCNNFFGNKAYFEEYLDRADTYSGEARLLLGGRSVEAAQLKDGAITETQKILRDQE